MKENSLRLITQKFIVKIKKPTATKHMLKLFQAGKCICITVRNNEVELDMQNTDLPNADAFGWNIVWDGKLKEKHMYLSKKYCKKGKSKWEMVSSEKLNTLKIDNGKMQITEDCPLWFSKLEMKDLTMESLCSQFYIQKCCIKKATPRKRGKFFPLSHR